MEGWGPRGTAFSHGGADLDVVQQLNSRGAWPAGVLPEDRRKLAQDQTDRSGGGLGSLPHDAMELRAAERRFSSDGEANRAAALYGGCGAGGDHRQGETPASVDAGGRFAGPAAGESGHHQTRRRDGDAGALWRGKVAHHRIPVDRVVYRSPRLEQSRWEVRPEGKE